MAKVGATPRLLVITIKVVGFPRVPAANHLWRTFLGLQLLLKMIFYMLCRKGDIQALFIGSINRNSLKE